MGFFAPWFLAGALAVGLPIWLHLLRQHKSTPLPFSSLMFFERRTQSSIKHRRLKYLLLLALRIALLILLALAFANPFIQSSSSSVSGESKLLVLAIDNSFSMSQGGRLDRAKQEASQAVGALRPSDRGQALSFASGVSVIGGATPDSGADVASLRASIQTIRPSAARGSFAELARALRSIAASAKIPVEAHVFSDMQKSSWPTNFADTRIGDGVKLVLHPVVNRREPNYTIETVNAPRRVYDPKKVRIQATVAAFGAGQASKKVALVLNGKELASKQVEVAAGGRASVEFLTLDAPYGMSKGEIRLEPADSFAADDRMYFPVERSDPRRILFVHDARNTKDQLYFRTALEASVDAAFALDVVAPEQVGSRQLNTYALVVLSDVGSLPPSLEDSLRAYVRGGGSLWLALGRLAAARGKVPVSEEVVGEPRYFAREAERFRTASDLDPAHPSIRRANQWEGVKFYQSVPVQPGKSKVLAKLTDGSPLLLEKQVGEGRVLIFASTFDNISNDFPLHKSFVPFIAETARYLGGLEEAGPPPVVGSHYELRATRGQAAAVEVLDPTGKRALSLEEASRAQTLALTMDGFYDIRRPNGRHELVAVNPDRRESDLDLLPADTLGLWQNTGQGGVAVTGQSEDGKKARSLWWYVMFATLLLAAAEAVAGNWHLSIDKEAA
ncbi:MAG: BatA domain-containing protein [Bryobacteraceae bacterium]